MTSLSLTLFASVMALSARRKGTMPDSVSEVAYIFPKWVFTVWIAFVAMLLMPKLMASLPEDRQWLGFLVAASAFCVAASPYYKTENKVLHYGGGVLCAIIALMVVTILHPWVLLSLVAVLFAPKKQMFVCSEIMVYLQLFLAL